MGMSASQARLLSITTRLTNNEFRSQMTANARVRLADKTQSASEEYMEALDSTKLQYVYYDKEGAKTQYALTAGTLLQYEPLKNQYALVNNAKQTMVNHGDASTFTQAKNLDEFLLLNDCITYREWQEPNPAYDKWVADEPQPTDPLYWVPGVTETSAELYDSFLWATAICYGAAMGALAGALGLTGGTVSDSNGKPVLYYDSTKWIAYDDQGNGTEISSGTVHSGNKECYSHVLDHLLNIGTYQTTTGDTLSIGSGEHWWQMTGLNDRGTRAAELANILSEDAAEVLLACGDTGQNITQTSSKVDLLLSDYYFDANGQKQRKTLQQKIVDLDYAMTSGLMTDQQAYDAIEHFVKKDLTVLNKTEDIFKEEEFNKDHDDWLAREPEQMLDLSEREIIDPDKTEWYTNLWYRMNGAYFDEQVKQNEGDFDFNILKEKYYDKVSDANQSWVEIDDNLLHSEEWLRFALESGAVSLEKVIYDTNYDTTTELKNKSWVSVTWSSTTDIVEVEDTLAITKAEVIYNKKLAEIQAEDKKLENDIKKLDTEHNALQTEYDSIKGVMDKNMERSFKAFS